MRKGYIATNMLGVCTPDMHFVYVLLGWKGSIVDGRVLRDVISKRHGPKVHHRNKRKWVPEEDVALVAWYNVGTYNADTGFKTRYLNELERMLEKVVPHAMLKAKLNLESIIRTLRSDWDEHRQMVVVEDVVWNSYISSHKTSGQFRHHSFPYYDQLTSIYAKDRATRKDAQTAADIVEEIDAEETVGLELSRSIASEKVLEESAQKLYPTLCKVEGLTKDERYRALSRIPYHPMQMLIFFSLPSSVRLEW
ncbi:hypothetical protein Goshw_027386, partial [Gossypium schwendimanii]|nr:hypothetical protein [Gossypium schwendimanii]